MGSPPDADRRILGSYGNDRHHGRASQAICSLALEGSSKAVRLRQAVPALWIEKIQFLSILFEEVPMPTMRAGYCPDQTGWDFVIWPEPPARMTGQLKE